MPLALSRKTASGSGINFSDNICCIARFDCNKTQPNTPVKVTGYKNEALPPPPKGRRGASLILYHPVLQKSIYAAKNRRHTFVCRHREGIVELHLDVNVQMRKYAVNRIFSPVGSQGAPHPHAKKQAIHIVYRLFFGADEGT